MIPDPAQLLPLWLACLAILIQVLASRSARKLAGAFHFQQDRASSLPSAAAHLVVVVIIMEAVVSSCAHIRGQHGSRCRCRSPTQFRRLRPYH